MHEQATTSAPPARIGLVGTGPMAQSFAKLIARHHRDLVVSRVLTRRPIESLRDAPFHGALTTALDDLVEHADIVVECSGDVAHGTAAIERAFQAGLPAVTLNAELHVTTGSYLAGKGYLSEAEGDQPGSLAALHEDAVQMGFRPLVYGNMKGFRNLNPSLQDMAYWAERQGISIPNTTGATDGTKVQIEQVLVANAYGATITKQGLEGPESSSLSDAANDLARIADRLGRPIADYVLAAGWAPTGIFIVARHDDDLSGLLKYFKLGDGPYYLLVKPYHLCSLEIAKTVRRALGGAPPLLNNSTQPTLGVGAVAKRLLLAGERIERGAGGFDLRGEAVKFTDAPRHVPIGIARNAVMRRRVEPGQLLDFDDIEIPYDHVVTIARESIAGAIDRSGR
jgi:predicted homoserine dehydrogenase-like protein